MKDGKEVVKLKVQIGQPAETDFSHVEGTPFMAAEAVVQSAEVLSGNAETVVHNGQLYLRRTDKSGRRTAKTGVPSEKYLKGWDAIFQPKVK